MNQCSDRECSQYGHQFAANCQCAAEHAQEEQKAITAAQNKYQGSDYAFDDEPDTSAASNGTWVAAWVWVTAQEIEAQA